MISFNSILLLMLVASFSPLNFTIMTSSLAINHLFFNSLKPLSLLTFTLIKQCRELALTPQDAGEFLRRRVEINYENGEEDLVEWIERKGGELYQLVELHEEGLVKLKNRLHELIQTSDGLLALHINWEDVAVLGPPFRRIL